MKTHLNNENKQEKLLLNEKMKSYNCWVIRDKVLIVLSKILLILDYNNLRDGLKVTIELSELDQ